MENYKPKISVIGLGYVGLPVAIHMAHKFETVGFDLNATRIKELREGHDRTCEVQNDEVKELSRVHDLRQENSDLLKQKDA